MSQTPPPGTTEAGAPDAQDMARLQQALADGQAALDRLDFLAALDAIATARSIPGSNRYPGLLDLNHAVGARCRRYRLLDAWEHHSFQIDNEKGSCVCLSADGRFALSGSQERLRLWDATTGNCVRVIEGQAERVQALGISRDGLLALSAYSGGVFRLWDLATGVCLRTLEWRGDEFRSVCFSPDGRLALLGGGYYSWPPTLELWDVAEGQRLWFYEGHDDEVTCTVFSPDGVFALSGSADGTLRLWDAANDECVQVFRRYADVVTSACFSPDSRFVLSGYRDGTLKLWDTAEGREVRTLHGHDEGVWSVAFSPDGHFALSGGLSERTLKMWDIVLGETVWSMPGYERGPISFTPDGRYALLGNNSSIELLEFDWEYVPQPEQIRSNLHNPDELSNLALHYIEQQREETAEVIWEAALQNNPAHLPSVYNRGLLLWRQGRQTDVEFLTQLRDAVAANNRADWPGDYLLAHVHYERGDFDKARFALSHALCKEPEQREPKALLERIGDNPGVRLVATSWGHKYIITSARFSPDGQFVLSGEADGTVRLWKVPKLECLQVFEGHTGRVATVCFSQDGQLALSASEDSTLRLWNMTSKECLRVFEGQGAVSVGEACFLEGCRAFLTAQWVDDSIKIWSWDITAGVCQQILTLRAKYTSLCFTPNGKLLLEGNYFDAPSLRLYETATGRCLQVLIESGFESGFGTSGMHFTPDSQFALTAHNSCPCIRLWNLNTRECVSSVPIPSGPFTVSISRDARFAAFHDGDGVPYLLDVHTGQCLHTLNQPDHHWAEPVLFSPDHSRLACISERIYLFDISSFTDHTPRAEWYLTHPLNEKEAQANEKQSKEVLAEGRAAFDRNDLPAALEAIRTARQIPGYHRHPSLLDLNHAIGEGGRRARLLSLWPIRSFKGHEGTVYDARFSPDGRMMLSGSEDTTIRLWDITTGQCLNTFKGHTTSVSSLDFSSDGQLIISGDCDGEVRLWNTTTAQCLRLLQGHTSSIYSVCISPDGRLALSGGDDSITRLWEVASGNCLLSVCVNKDKIVRMTCFSPDGRSAWSGLYDEMWLWSVATGNRLREFKIQGECDAMVFSPDGRLALSASDGALALWDVATERQLRTLEKHEAWVFSLCFSQDDELALSVSEGMLRLSHVVTGKCLSVFEGYGCGIWREPVRFSPNWRYLLSKSDDATLRLWELDWEFEPISESKLDNDSQPKRRRFGFRK